MKKIFTLADIQANPEIQVMLEWANSMLASLGYTEHGTRHTGFVAATAAKILQTLGYPDHDVHLAAITGWIHDVGNGINRKNHGLTGASLLFPVLRDMGMDIADICSIIAAVGNHEEQSGFPVSPLAAALILADKADAHRSRVRRGGEYDPKDIHDRVNYAILGNKFNVDAHSRIICYEVQMDDTASVMEFLEIYFTRMRMSEKAAAVLDCGYELLINGMRINRLDRLTGGEEQA